MTQQLYTTTSVQGEIQQPGAHILQKSFLPGLGGAIPWRPGSVTWERLVHTEKEARTRLHRLLRLAEHVLDNPGKEVRQISPLKQGQEIIILRFSNGSPVRTNYTVKYLGSMINWLQPFDVACKHRAALAQEACKKLRLIWNSTLSQARKLQIFLSTFVPVLTYGLDALNLTMPYIKRIDAYYIRFLRRVVGVKASYYPRIPNTEVHNRAHIPKLPSQTLNDIQLKMMKKLLMHPELKCFTRWSSAHKDRVLSQGRRRGMQFPDWIELMSKQYSTLQRCITPPAILL